MSTAIATGTANITPERLLLRLDWQVIRRLDGLLQHLIYLAEWINRSILTLMAAEKSDDFSHCSCKMDS